MPEWEQVAALAPIWKPKEKGEKIEGTVIKIGEGPYGRQAEIKTDKGIFATPSSKGLVRMLEDCKVEDYLRITYKGWVKGKQRDYQDWLVERKRTA